MAPHGVRLGIAGATGALGSEVLTLLDAARIPIAQLVAVAGPDSLGCEIDFQGRLVPVATELPALRGLDAFVNCAPASCAPELVRAALRAEVPCIDASGAFASREEVPLLWATGGDRVGSDPLLASPVGAALPWVALLRPLAEIAPLVRVTATVLDAASAAGRGGIDALSHGSLALFNHQELPEDASSARPLAFDCHPDTGSDAGIGDAGRPAREQALEAALARLLPSAPRVSARWIRIPAFVGQATSLLVEARRPLEVAEAAERLAKAVGVEVWQEDLEGPNLRAAAGRDAVIVGRPERDAAHPGALRLWAAADVLRLAAANAVALVIGGLEARGALAARRPH